MKLVLHLKTFSFNPFVSFKMGTKTAAAGCRISTEEFTTDSLPSGYLSFEKAELPPQRHEDAENLKPSVKPQRARSRRKRRKQNQPSYGRLTFYFRHYVEPLKGNG